MIASCSIGHSCPKVTSKGLALVSALVEAYLSANRGERPAYPKEGRPVSTAEEAGWGYMSPSGRCEEDNSNIAEESSPEPPVSQSSHYTE
jgi:hypothetical protein